MAVELRLYREADREHFAALFGDAQVSGFVGGPKTYVESCRLFDALVNGCHPRALVAFAVDELESSREAAMVGHAVLFRHDEPTTVEIGYMLQKQSWGRGLGTAIAVALVSDARDRGYRVVLGSVDTDNHASRRILEKLGGTARIASDEDGDYLEFRIVL